MEKFISYEKLSKKERSNLNKMRRTTWGALNPVTRKPQNPKAYKRKRAQQWTDDSKNAESFCCSFLSSYDRIA